VTAPLFLLGPPALAAVRPGARVVLDGPEGRHAATVRRIVAGERVDVGDGAGRVARCTAVGVWRDVVELAVDAVDDVPQPAVRLTLAQALAKGGRDELAIEAATEVGVDVVVPYRAARSVVVWTGERGQRARAKWVATVREAGKQARRAWLPDVTALHDRATLARRCSAAALALVLHEEAAEALSAVPLPQAGELLVVVGPEGGLEAAEVDELVAVGAHAVRLGPTVLRSSTAGPAALAVLSARLGRW